MKKVLMFPWHVFIFLRQSFVNIIFLFILIGLIAALFSDDKIKVPESAILVIEPKGVLVNQLSYSDPWASITGQNGPQETLVTDITTTLEKAADDDRVKGVLLSLNSFAGGNMANLHRVANSLEAFKATGKPIYAYADGYDQSGYFLAASATSIQQPPMGSTLITGFSAYRQFFKGAADKLGINVNVFKVGRYKSAVEPYFLDAMSEDAKANAREYMGDLWASYTDSVEKRRKLAPGKINDMISNLDADLAAINGNIAKHGIDQGLVDKLAYRDQLRMELIELVGQDENGSYNHIGLTDYLDESPSIELPSNSKIAHIVASGAIMNGEQKAGSIGGVSLSKVIRDAREDETVKAIVLQVESGGGSAFASERIRRELEIAQEAGKKVVISMSGVAASGGYWISASADKIIAQPDTITGSIGVFGVIPTFESTFAKVGVTTDGVGTTDLAGAMRTDRALSPKVKNYIQGSVDTIYDEFLALVAKGRNMTKEQVHEIAQGKVWSGKRALDIGLVDQLGTVDDAFEEAAKLAGIENYQVKLFEKKLTKQEEFVRELKNMSVDYGLAPSNDSLVSKLVHDFSQSAASLTQLDDPNHVYAQCFDCDINELK